MDDNGTLDERTAKILKDCGLGSDSLWMMQRGSKKLWIIYHWACERAAAVKGITWEPPQVIHADPERKLAVVLVTGKLGGHTEWSFGEAAPYNTKQAYPFAMAEKRAKDRVILKLIGLHGLAYSEEEADDFQEPKNHGEAHGPLGVTELKKQLRNFNQDLADISDEDELTALLTSSTALTEQCARDLPTWWYGKQGSDIEGIGERITKRQNELKQAETIYDDQAAE